MTRAVVPMGPILRCEPFAGWLRSVTCIVLHLWWWDWLR
jgi:hypothetical protein